MFVYFRIFVRAPELSKWGVGIPLIGLTSPRIRACLRIGPGFPTRYILV